jgi:hypothetical protein
MEDKNSEKREFGVILESIESNVQYAVEAADTNTNILRRVEDDVAAVKSDVSTLKDDMAAVRLL